MSIVRKLENFTYCSLMVLLSAILLLLSAFLIGCAVASVLIFFGVKV